jgi:hypothetical protein
MLCVPLACLHQREYGLDLITYKLTISLVWALDRSNISPHREYETLRLLVLVFLGGSVNTMAIKGFSDFYSSYSKLARYGQVSQQAWIELAAYGILVFVLPILLSLVYSIGLEKRIAPPFYIQLVTLALLIQLAFNDVIPYNFGTFYYLFMYAIVGGLVQDKIVVSTVGRVARRDDFSKFSLYVNADLPMLKRMLELPKYRDHVGLRKKPEETDRGFVFSSRSKYRIQTLLELERGSLPNETFINLVAYERKPYSVRTTDDVEENTRALMAYLKDVLRRQKSSIDCKEELGESSATHTEFLVSLAMDSLQGLSTRMRDMSVQKSLAIIAGIVSWSLAIGLFLFGRADFAFAMVGTAIYVTFELRGLLKND